MSAPANANPPANKGVIIAVIVGVIMLLGMCSSSLDKKPTTSSDGKGVYYPTAWCETHKDDQYRGAVDNDTVMRYIHECRGK